MTKKNNLQVRYGDLRDCVANAATPLLNLTYGGASCCSAIRRHPWTAMTSIFAGQDGTKTMGNGAGLIRRCGVVN